MENDLISKSKKMLIKPTDDNKISFIRRRFSAAKKCFTGNDVKDRKKFINSIRVKFGYSPKTVDVDIYNSFETAWRTLIGNAK